MSDLGLLTYGLISFFVSIASGIAGGGGGFVTTPLAIFLGLSPAQSIAAGKFGGFASALGTMRSLKGHKSVDKKLFLTLLIAAAAIGIVAPFIISSIDPSLYKNFIGILLITVSILMLKSKITQEKIIVAGKRYYLGIGSVAVGYLMVALFSSGVGVLINIAMMRILGMDALDSMLLKRSISLVMNGFLIIGVTVAGLVIWNVVIIGVIASMCGAYIGGKIAVKKGAPFVSKILALLALISGLGLILI